jgi:hypothetical protein
MSQYQFGSGVLIGTPLTTFDGTVIANPSPIQFGAVQDITIDISSENKTLHGQNQFPLAVGRGKAKVSGKAKFAQINGAIFNSLFFGQTLSNGIQADVIDTTGMLIPATPFTITASTTNSLTTFAIPSSGVWAYDLGVVNASGLPMKRVASAPTSGQYSVSGAGVYVFAAADTGLRVFINYSYTATSTTASKSTVTNVLMGQAPTFQADFFNTYNGKTMTFKLYACIATKLSFATKLDDFLIPELDFESFANSAGQVLDWATTE